MSIIIEGYEKPEKCKLCRFNTDAGLCKAMPENFCGSTDEEKTPDWCPLIELPTLQASRLIDADKLMEHIRFVYKYVNESEYEFLKDIIYSEPAIELKSGVVHCRECIYRPKLRDPNGEKCGHNVLAGASCSCPCICREDEEFNTYPEDTWFCGSGARAGGDGSAAADNR